MPNKESSLPSNAEMKTQSAGSSNRSMNGPQVAIARRGNIADDVRGDKQTAKALRGLSGPTPSPRAEQRDITPDASRPSPVLGSFRKGGNVRKTGLYRLHKGERVVPRRGKGR